MMFVTLWTAFGATLQLAGRKGTYPQQSLARQQGAPGGNGREALLGGLRTFGQAFAPIHQRAGKCFARRFKRAIHVVDSTTIQLIASCMDWAKHRRRQAAAKCYLRLDLQSFLPRFAIVDTAKHNDAKRARELCAGIKPGEIVIFDKAYVDFSHLADLSVRQVFWVTRAKENLCYRV